MIIVALSGCLVGWTAIATLGADTAATTRPAGPEAGVGVDALIAAERAFSRAAGERGIQAAFLEFLADDAVLFRPGPVNGKAWLREHPPDPGKLTWEPTQAEIAAGGDLGLSTGPWSYAVDETAAPVAFGQFFSIWRRNADGRWEVVLDFGISHPDPGKPPGSSSLRAPAAVTTPQRQAVTGGGGDRDSLLAADRASAAALSKNGATAYHGAFAHAGILVLRSGTAPAVGRAAVAAAVSDDGVLAWEPAFAQVSRSGDFGYTYGSTRPAAPGEGERNYARVWRREGSGAWQVVLDVADAAPRPAPPASLPPPTSSAPS